MENPGLIGNYGMSQRMCQHILCDMELINPRKPKNPKHNKSCLDFNRGSWNRKCA